MPGPSAARPPPACGRPELVVAGEDQRPLLPHLAGGGVLLLLDLQVQEASEQVQERVGREHLVPQVGRPLAALISGLPAAIPLPRLKGRNRVRPSASRVVICASSGSTAKCTSAPRLKAKIGSAGIAVVAVLLHGVRDRLAGDRVLQFDRHHRDAVDRQHQVERVPVLVGVAQLPRDREPVGLVELARRRG